MARVVVIGSGIGGAAVSGLLAQRGLKVTLIERHPFAGGKSASYEHDGFVFDMGVHYALLGENGPLGIVARRISADLEFLTSDPCIRLVWGNRSYRLPRHFTRLMPLLRIAWLVGLKPKELLKKIQCLKKLTGAESINDIDPFDDFPLKEFINQYTDDPAFHNLLDLLCGIMLAVPPEVASTGEYMWVLSSFLKARSPAYPRGGFARVAQSYIDAMIRHGGKVHFNERVKKIVIEDGRVTGVTTDKSIYRANIIVSNAGISRTIGLAGRNHFDSAYVKKTDSLHDSFGALTIKYGLDYKPTNVPLTFYCPENFNAGAFLDPMSRGEIPEGDPPLYIPAPSLLDPSLAPEGKHVLLAGTMVPNDLKDKGQIKKLISRVDKKVMELFPDIQKHILFRHTTGLKYTANLSGRETGDVVGLGQRFDQVGKNKPHPRMPVEGLYLVGCDAGGRGIGTEQAADSALNVTEMILKDHNMSIA